MSFPSQVSSTFMPETKNTVLVKFVVNGEEVGSMLLNPKTFSTGSQGYFGTGKL